MTAPGRWPRHALITGASRGLGLELATLLAEAGTRLIVTARGDAALNAAAQRLRRHGADVTAIAGDVADVAHHVRLAEVAGDRLDLLVHNASALGPSPLPHLLEVETETLERVWRTNVAGPLALTRTLRPALTAGRGLLVHLGSDAAHGGWPGWGVYGAAKAAFELAARTLAAEAPELVPVIVDPGDLRTDMHQAAFPDEDISDRPLPEITRPFWHWLMAQEDAAIRGRRFEAQGAVWATTEPVGAGS